MPGDDRAAEAVEAWMTNHRITMRILAAVDDTGLSCTLSTRGGRSVARQFGHLQYVRVYQLEGRAKRLAAGLRRFATGEEPTRAELVDALEESAGRVAEWLRRAAAGEKGFLPFRKGLVTTVAYLVAHESHHRGSILLTLKQCGHPVDPKVRMAIWDWDRA